MCDCDRALELISLELDDRLTPEEAAVLRAHLRGCADCRRAAEELRALHTLLPELEEEIPEGLHRAIMDRIAAEKVVPLSRIKNTSRLRRWASLAAVFAVILLGAGTWQALQGGGASSGTTAPAAVAPAARDGTEAAGAETEGARAKEAAGTGGAAVTTQESGDAVVQEQAGTGDSADLRMEPAASGALIQKDTGGENGVLQAPQTAVLEVAPAEAGDSGAGTADQETTEALRANCVAWLASSSLDCRARVDTSLISVARVTGGELSSAVCGDADRQAMLDDTDWAVTLGDTAGHDFAVLLCDSETLEVLGHVPVE